ncbi:MAG: DotU family type IV/VI secretion system protein [Planctomycetes bacterium]|nr:DotU family type IV/VI secretion system protein [Planctomycetota bacterium]MCB9934428.1 DotU family type IV/VI secretion system protein [Planctomycetota bacterium]
MANEGETRPRLADLCAEVFAFAFQLRASKDPGSATDVKHKVVNLFAEFEQKARTGGFKPESIQTAKYAMTAFLDEIVLSSKSPMKDEWAGSPLQLELFNDFAAGEEFYTKLKAIRGTSDVDRRELTDIYFLCLTHGFKGMYIDLKGMEERRALLEQLAHELKENRPGDPVNLSPAWQPPDSLPRLVRSTPTWLVPAVCAVILILLLLVLAMTSQFMANGAIEALTGMES